MASPVETFKTNLFGQLKSYGDAVQGVFEQRIARPLLALKRDLRRTSSTTRTASEQESEQDFPSLLTPTDVVEVETNGSLKTILDKVKNTLSPSPVKRSVIEILPIDKSEETRRSSIHYHSDKDPRLPRLRQQKSVSFATETADNKIHEDPRPSPPQFIDEIRQRSSERSSSTSSSEDQNDDFRRQFYQKIKPRRISIGNSKDLVYQDLSAEIVAYVLKHALRALEKEDEQWMQLNNHNGDDEDDDFIDLK